MANFTGIVYLTEEQFTTLKDNGTITVDGITLNYDENTLYVTPETNNESQSDSMTLKSEVLTVNNFNTVIFEKINNIHFLKLSNISSTIQGTTNYGIEFTSSTTNFYSNNFTLLEGGYSFMFKPSIIENDRILFSCNNSTANIRIAITNYDKSCQAIREERTVASSSARMIYSLRDIETEIQNGTVTLTLYYWE